ncbi:MAG TPA: septation protein A, partial [Thiothrix sp.]|nr:septation protein A [Thiothrix sp.]
MKFLFDFFPVLLFFLVYKFFGDLPPEMIMIANQIPYINLSLDEPKDAIYMATLVLILATIVQNLLHYIVYAKFEKMHLISLAVLIVFGSLTLAFKNPDFIMWKVTIFNVIFALVFLGSQFIGSKMLVERMLDQAFDAPKAVWAKANLAWVLFFFAVGLINLYVAYNLPEEVWVNFKLFGIMGLTFAFMIAQIIYLRKYVKQEAAPAANDQD